MTEANESFSTHYRYIIDELNAPDCDEADVNTLIESASRLFPEVTTASFDDYWELNSLRNLSKTLSQDTLDGLDDFLLETAELLAECNLQDFEYACLEGTKEEQQECLFIMGQLADDSGKRALHTAPLNFDQYLRFRAFDDLLGDDPTYIYLVGLFEEYRAEGKMIRHLDPEEVEASEDIPGPAVEASTAPNLLGRLFRRVTNS